jgi:acyl-CoA dehydrogenase
MLWILVSIIVLWILAYAGVALWLATLIIVAGLSLYTAQYGLTFLSGFLWGFVLLLLIPANLPPLRRHLISRFVLKFLRNALPSISQTEREALEAGNVWWDAELFSGRPNWKRLLDLPISSLTAKERAFIDGPVEELCRMLDDWQITHELNDLPEEVWTFIRSNGFFGMIIPKRYGGLEFSATAHSEVVMKISSRSIAAAVTVMVPNSLGPAKLLLAYGTEEQKNRLLPRLANGDEIPCFALTGPEAGSDAGAMPDEGIVCRSEFEGRSDVLGIRLNWEKRYITLGPVATLLGLAFKLYDPDGLLGDKKELGITVALIPTDTPGISIGNRHFPLDSAFQNGPNRGADVFIPIEWVIGGKAQVGNGWRMLMECLGEGRSISLPALSTGAAKLASRATGAYARVRRQFNVPIGQFEGIEEPLARIAGHTYLMDATRRVTLAALDGGEKPSVISAIIKHELTEKMRSVVNHAMDIQAGSGICLGPRNYIGRVYQAVPISITVEGANILTRSMIIFGQGAIRCHPYLQQEIEAARMSDEDAAIRAFDWAFFKHIGFTLGNLARAFWLGLSNARLLRVPGTPQTCHYYRQINRLSAGFALVADVALFTLGGSLKRKERLSGRFADVLSNLYLCSATLKHYHDQGEPEADLPLVDWACRYTIHRAQQSLLAVFWNLPNRPLAFILRALVFPNGKPYSPPGDRTIHEAAVQLLTESPTRDRLTQGIFINADKDDRTGRIEHAFHAVLEAEPAAKKLRDAVRQGVIGKGRERELVEEALAQGIIDAAEAEQLRLAREATQAAIRVDEFPP